MTKTHKIPKSFTGAIDKQKSNPFFSTLKSLYKFSEPLVAVKFINMGSNNPKQSIRNLIDAPRDLLNAQEKLLGIYLFSNALKINPEDLKSAKARIEILDREFMNFESQHSQAFLTFLSAVTDFCNSKSNYPDQSNPSFNQLTQGIKPIAEKLAFFTIKFKKEIEERSDSDTFNNVFDIIIKSLQENKNPKVRFDYNKKISTQRAVALKTILKNNDVSSLSIEAQRDFYANREAWIEDALNAPEKILSPFEKYLSIRLLATNKTVSNFEIEYSLRESQTRSHKEAYTAVTKQLIKKIQEENSSHSELDALLGRYHLSNDFLYFLVAKTPGLNDFSTDARDIKLLTKRIVDLSQKKIDSSKTKARSSSQDPSKATWHAKKERAEAEQANSARRLTLDKILNSDTENLKDVRNTLIADAKSWINAIFQSNYRRGEQSTLFRFMLTGEVNPSEESRLLATIGTNAEKKYGYEIVERLSNLLINSDKEDVNKNKQAIENIYKNATEIAYFIIWNSQVNFDKKVTALDLLLKLNSTNSKRVKANQDNLKEEINKERRAKLRARRSFVNTLFNNNLPEILKDQFNDERYLRLLRSEIDMWLSDILSAGEEELSTFNKFAAVIYMATGSRDHNLLSSLFEAMEQSKEENSSLCNGCISDMSSEANAALVNATDKKVFIRNAVEIFYGILSSDSIAPVAQFMTISNLVKLILKEKDSLGVGIKSIQNPPLSIKDTREAIHQKTEALHCMIDKLMETAVSGVYSTTGTNGEKKASQSNTKDLLSCLKYQKNKGIEIDFEKAKKKGINPLPAVSIKAAFDELVSLQKKYPEFLKSFEKRFEQFEINAQAAMAQEIGAKKEPSALDIKKKDARNYHIKLGIQMDEANRLRKLMEDLRKINSPTQSLQQKLDECLKEQGETKSRLDRNNKSIVRMKKVHTLAVSIYRHFFPHQ